MSLKPRPDPVSIGRLSLFTRQNYSPELRRALIEFMKSIEGSRRKRKRSDACYNRGFQDRVLEIKTEDQSELLKSFWLDEPIWKKRYEFWLTLI